MENDLGNIIDNSKIICTDNNELTKILKAFTNKDWNWYELSRNSNITWEFIQANPNKSWNQYALSINPNITWEITKENKNIQWDFYGLSFNPNITWEIIQANPNLRWSQFSTNITWEIVKDNFNVFSKNGVNEIAKISNLTLEIVYDHPHYNWNWYDLLRNPSIITNYSGNPVNIIKEIKIPKGLNSYLQNISANPAITWEIVHANPSFKWDWYWISMNDNITWEIISSNSKIPWNRNNILRNPNITWEIIQSNMNCIKNMSTKKLHLSNFSYNPNLTLEIIDANPQIRWNWQAISENKFKKHPVLITKQRKIFSNILTCIF